MGPDPVVERLYVVEDLECRLLAPAEGAGVHALALDYAHERLHGGVVPRAGYRAHRGLDPGVAHRPPQEQRHVLRAVIRMVDAALGRPATRDRHPEGVVGELGRHAARHRPADYPARPDVEHHRQVEPSLVRAHVGDVGEPRPVGTVRAEVALDQVGGGVRLRRGGLPPALGPLGASPRGSDQAPLAHDSGHAFARRAHAVRPEPLEHLGRAEVAAPKPVHALDVARQLRVAQVASARPARAPCVVALARHLQRGAHLRDRPDALVHQDEGEPRPLRLGAYSCLLAKKALAFKSISFSRLSLSTSRFSLRFSSATWKGLSPG